MAPLVRRTWALRGRTPIFCRTGRAHRKVSAIAALTVPARRKRVGLYFSLYPNANITALRARSFLRQLSRQIQKRLLVIWDRSNTHRAKLMDRHFARSKRMHRAYFPPYAPELNPVEMLWSYLKRNPLANVAAPDVDALFRTTRYHARRLRSRKELLRSFLYATPLFSRRI
jgi:transposase